VFGTGEATFERRVAALAARTMIDLPWIAPLRREGLPAVGDPVTFASHQLGAWMRHACRVVEVVEEDTAQGRARGFAYGTTAWHAVAGEERFTVRWDHESDEVTYEIRRFSRPKRPLVRLFAPVARALQVRFMRDSLQAMRRAVT